MTNDTIQIKKMYLAEIIKYLQAATNTIHHIHHAIFDKNYKTKLNLSNEEDLNHIKIKLLVSIASLRREIAELSNLLTHGDYPEIEALVKEFEHVWGNSQGVTNDNQ
tara:strand:+ start:697 stop:1017 length:321 start_codon:yes stop_codon:yes gene_type:complete